MEIFRLFGSILVEDKAAMNSLSKVDKEGSKLAGGFGKLGGIITGAFSVVAIVAFGKKIVESSANLGAMKAQFDQVFKDGENEKAVKGITKQVDDLGIHADRLTGTWNKFGGQVKGAGMESEQALQAVDKATRLAADGAAFFDKSLESSSDSLASFMKGNFAAGDAIGVFTSAKQMDVKANDMYGKSWADLSESERQWLLLDTVEKTYEMNGAMGQASREAGSYENVMGNLRATFQRLYATIGEPVLEIFLGVVQNVTAWVESNMPLIEETISGIFEGIKWAWDNVAKPVLSVLFDIFINIFNYVRDNWPTISTIFSTVFDGIKWAWDNVLSPVLDVLLTILGKVVKYISDNFPTAQATVETVFSAIGNAVEKVTGFFGGLVDGIKEAIDWLKSYNVIEVKDKTPNKSTVYSSGQGGGGRSMGAPLTNIVDGVHANGLASVPWDGYLGVLHKNEEVLRADDPRNQNNNKSGINQIVNIYSPTALTPSEVARQVKNASRELVMGV